MPHEIIVPASVDGLDWTALRKGLKNCIQKAAPKAVVFSNWPLKYDVRQTTAILKSKKDDGNLHAWIIGINKAIPSEGGRAGGYYLEWELSLRIWGFVGYEYADDSETQNTLETELRKATQIIYLNQKHLGLDSTSGLKEVNLLEFEDIDVQYFEGGNDVYVAQGSLSILTNEAIVASP